MSCSTSFSSAYSDGVRSASSSELLFGEIESCTTLNSFRSKTSVCNLTLSTNSTFLKFWLSDDIRNTFISHVNHADFAALRLVCHDFAGRIAPLLFKDVHVTFKPTSFTRPARMAALERVGQHVRSFTFTAAHSKDTTLAPLIDPCTGEETAFVYEPQTHSPGTLIDKVKHPKYGSWELADLLIKQYPPLFHAATNVPAFCRAFAALPNLEQLHIRCPGYDTTRKYRRSVVDYALISLRIAVEHAPLDNLRSLLLLPIHEDGLLYLQPTFAFGASPKAVKRWSQIENLSLEMESCEAAEFKSGSTLKILHSYLRNFSSLQKFYFRWAGAKGPCPLSLHSEPDLQPSAARNETMDCSSMRRLRFTKLKYMVMENALMDARQICAFVKRHKRTLVEFTFEDVKLRSGDWDEALSPLSRVADRQVPSTPQTHSMDVPLMLSPEDWDEKVSLRYATENEDARRRTGSSLSRWLSKRKAIRATSRAKEQLFGGSEQVKKFLRTSVMPWR